MVVFYFLTAGGPTYTQLGGNQNVANPQGNFAHASPGGSGQGMWPPQWQGGASEGQQAASGQQVQQAAPQQPGSTQNEEFSDMFRMLDPPGQEFSDISGMFNTFPEWKLWRFIYWWLLHSLHLEELWILLPFKTCVKNNRREYLI